MTAIVFRLKTSNKNTKRAFYNGGQALVCLLLIIYESGFSLRIWVINVHENSNDIGRTDFEKLRTMFQ